MFREQIKVLDCTIRDGGLMNRHQFDERLVREVYKKVSKAGLDYMEIGYKNSKEFFSTDEYGLWKFCDDDVIRKTIDGIESNTKLAVMVDVGRVNVDEVVPTDESPVDMIRVATYVKDIDKAIYLANNFYDKGYETTINIMAISRDSGFELDQALNQVENESNVIAVYIVDSFGALYQETVEDLIKRAKRIAGSKEIGFHGHNPQQLAFSNTIEAIIHGANYMDATIYGMGRGAGNCPLELLLGFLKNPKFDIRPILDLISEEFLAVREGVEWGYIIPYAIAGILNEHPRDAMALRDSDKKENYREFWESLTNTGLD